MEFVIDLQVKKHASEQFKKSRAYLKKINQKLNEEREYIFSQWKKQWPTLFEEIKQAHGFPERLPGDTVSTTAENEAVSRAEDIWGHNKARN